MAELGGAPARPWRARAPRPPAREWLYGRQAVREALQLAGRRGIRGEEHPADELTKLLGPVNHQGVALLCDPYAYADLDDLLDAPPPAPLYLLLDSLQDPQNFGTLLRTAEAVGVTGVLIPEHRQVGVTPAVVNASSGAVEHLAIARVTNLARTIGRLKEAGVWVAGLEQAPEATAPWATDLTGPLALVVGGEGEGLGRLVLEHCDYRLALPMLGHLGSLNAAVAGSVALYEILRQRQQAPRA